MTRSMSPALRRTRAAASSEEAEERAARRATTVAVPDSRFELDRRRFLVAAAAGTAYALVDPRLAAIAEAATPAPAGSGILVVVTLEGGHDFLSMVPPTESGAYRTARGALAHASSSTLPLTSTRRLHPDLTFLASKWAAGDVAFVDGVGNPAGTLSHFASMADHHHAGPGAATNGWLGRYLDGAAPGLFTGVSVGSRLPLLTSGRNRSAVLIPDQVGYFGDLVSGDQGLSGLLDSFAAGPTGLGELGDLAARTGADLFPTARTLAPVYTSDAPSGLASPMRTAARVLNANVGTRVVTVDHRGYDSHIGQAAQHGARMRELDAGLRAFFGALDAAVAPRVTVLLISEFGRRFATNGSAGTDHGAAGGAVAVGARVRGGFYGALPSFTDLTREGSLKTTVDYRDLYGYVLTSVLGADGSAIIGRAGSLGFIETPTTSEPSDPPAPKPPAPKPPAPTGDPITAVEADVLRLYRAFFGREPDRAGARYWIAKHRDGESLDAIAEYFTASPEFAARYAGTSNARFVAAVYRNVLGRTYDRAGYDYWRGMLDRRELTRGGVVRWVAANSEFRSRHPYTHLP